MSLLGMLTHTCTVQRSTAKMSTRRATRRTWANHTTGVRFKLSPRGGEAGRQEFGQEVEYDFVGYFQAGTALRPTKKGEPIDRLVDVKPLRTGSADTTMAYEVVAGKQHNVRRRGLQIAALRIVRKE